MSGIPFINPTLEDLKNQQKVKNIGELKKVFIKKLNELSLGKETALVS